MTDNIELQSRLLERYLDQLARGSQPAAPRELDAGIADLARALQTRLTPPEPTPAFVDGLAARLAREARARPRPTPLVISRKSINGRSANGRDADLPPTLMRASIPEIAAARPRSWRRELAGIAAAIAVLVVVVLLLAAAFDLHDRSSDNSVPASQPAPTQPLPTQPSMVQPVTVAPLPSPTPLPTPLPTPTDYTDFTFPRPPVGWQTLQSLALAYFISRPPGWDYQWDGQAGTPLVLTSWTMPKTGGGGIPEGGIKIQIVQLPGPIPSGGTTYAPMVDGHAAVVFTDESLTVASPDSSPPASSFAQAPHDLIIFYQIGRTYWQISALSTESLIDGSPARAIVDQIIHTIHYSP